METKWLWAMDRLIQRLTRDLQTDPDEHRLEALETALVIRKKLRWDPAKAAEFEALFDAVAMEEFDLTPVVRR